jgi:hypothetical protein
VYTYQATKRGPQKRRVQWDFWAKAVHPDARNDPPFWLGSVLATTRRTAKINAARRWPHWKREFVFCKHGQKRPF